CSCSSVGGVRASVSCGRSARIVATSSSLASVTRSTITRVPRRRRLPPGGARLRRRLTPLAAGSVARGACPCLLHCAVRRSLGSFASGARGTRDSPQQPREAPVLEHAALGLALGAVVD